MPKLLVNAPTGDQRVIEVNESGGYFDESLVLWDERKDGPLPDVTLNGMVRNGNSLAFDQTKFDGYKPPVIKRTKPPVEKLIEKLLEKNVLTAEEATQLRG